MQKGDFQHGAEIESKTRTEIGKGVPGRGIARAGGGNVPGALRLP